MTTSGVTVSSHIPTSEYQKYPLNSLSREETALKVSALVLAFLCIGGAVAIAMGGQFVLPEIIMAPIPQVIVESLLGLTAIGLLVQVIVFSVKGQSKQKNILEADLNINRTQLTSLDALTEENERAKATIFDLLTKIEQLQQNPTGPERTPNVGYATMTGELENALQKTEAKFNQLLREKEQLLVQLDLAQKKFEVAQTEWDEGNKTLNNKISTLEGTNRQQLEGQDQLTIQLNFNKDEFEKEKAILNEENVALKGRLQSVEEMNAAYKQEEQGLKAQLAIDKKGWEEEKATLSKTNEELRAASSKLEEKIWEYTQEKKQLEAQLAEAQRGFDEAKAALEKAKGEMHEQIDVLKTTHFQEKEQLEAQLAEAQRGFDEAKAALEKAKGEMHEQIDALKATHFQEKEQLEAQLAEAQRGFDEAKAALEKS